MISFILFILFSFSIAIKALYTSDSSTQKSLWEAWKIKYMKTYLSSQESIRFNNFVDNLKLIDERNNLEVKAGGSAFHDLTRFSDLSQSEFESQFLRATSVTINDIKTVQQHLIGNEYGAISTEADMASYVQSTHSLYVCVDSTNWNTYSSGVQRVCGKKINHCIHAVVADTTPEGYWKLRNKWGIQFGEKGFIKLAYGKDTCGITYLAKNKT